MVAAARRQRSKPQETKDSDRFDPRTVPGAYVKTPGGLRAYVESFDPKNLDKILITYESKSLGTDSYNPSTLTLIQESPNAPAIAQPTTAQAEVVTESKLDAERVLKTHKLEAVTCKIAVKALFDREAEIKRIEVEINRLKKAAEASTLNHPTKGKRTREQETAKRQGQIATLERKIARLKAQPTLQSTLSQQASTPSNSTIAPTHPSSPIPPPPDRLSTLATQINTLHSQGCEAEATAIAAGKAALQLRKEEGDRLLEAKAQLKHGQWGKWLKANCPTISERSCQLYMQLAEGWEEHIAKNETVADLTLREAIALLPKRTKTAEPASPSAPSPLDYTPLSEPRSVWFKVGDSWTEGQAIAENGNGLIRIVWGENRESDIPGWRVEWSKPLEQEAAATQITPETKAGLAAAGLSICTPSITPAEFNREMWGDKPPAVSYTPTTFPPVACQLCQHRTLSDGTESGRYWCERGEFDDTLPINYDWAKDGNDGCCKSFDPGNHPLDDRALKFERQASTEPETPPETPIVRLKVKRGKGNGVEILGAIVQCNGITHYLQSEDLTLEDF